MLFSSSQTNKVLESLYEHAGYAIPEQISHEKGSSDIQNVSRNAVKGLFFYFLHQPSHVFAQVLHSLNAFIVIVYFSWLSSDTQVPVA
jgi:esterase/lipase superfamily enzyme